MPLQHLVRRRDQLMRMCAAPTTEDVKRLQEYEVQLHGSCSAPMGLAILNNGEFERPVALQH